MNSYRRGAVLGLTIAETFILLTFLLLIALLVLFWQDKSRQQAEATVYPVDWVLPNEIVALRNAAEAARKAQEEAEEALAAADLERDRALDEAKAAREAQEAAHTAQQEAEEALAAADHERGQAQDEAEAAREAREEAERAHAAAALERDQALEEAEAAHTAQQEAEEALAAADLERDRALDEAEAARKAQKEAEETSLVERLFGVGAENAQQEAEEALAAAERDRDRALEEAKAARAAQKEAEEAIAAVERERRQAQRNLALLRRKGENPPCWYQIVSAGEGKTREKPYYAFNVAIYEDSIELARRTPPPGGALDDGGGPYADEWRRLNIEYLPYGKRLTDTEFADAVSELVAQGRKRQVRTYECVFSVMVWDKTPQHAKKRWKDAHDRIIEGSFSAYTVQDLPWNG